MTQEELSAKDQKNIAIIREKLGKADVPLAYFKRVGVSDAGDISITAFREELELRGQDLPLDLDGCGDVFKGKQSSLPECQDLNRKSPPARGK